MHRRRFITAAASAFAAPLGARAQSRRRIGVLVPGSVPDPSSYPQPLLQGLRELGWIEGENIVIERRIASDRTEHLPGMAEELVALKVEAIVTIGTPAALAARKATASIPIVMATIADPVAAGLVASLARPGGNVTGNTFIEPDLTSKRLQILREVLPAATRIGEMMNPTNPSMQMLRLEEGDALRVLGMRPIFVDVVEPGGLEPAFADLARQRADALVVHSDSLLVSHRVRIMELALSHRLPTMTEARLFAEAGGMLSYGASTVAMVHNAAKFVDKILRGASPAELPVERPTRFDLVINQRSAKALGVTIPHSVLMRANEVVE